MNHNWTGKLLLLSARNYWQVPPTHFAQKVWPLRFVAFNIVVKIFLVRPANSGRVWRMAWGKMDPNMGFSNPFSTWMKLWSVTLCYLNTLNSKYSKYQIWSNFRAPRRGQTPRKEVLYMFEVTHVALMWKFLRCYNNEYWSTK